METSDTVGKPYLGVHQTGSRPNSGTKQPATVPLNSLGMANWAIPKFRVEVA